MAGWTGGVSFRRQEVTLVDGFACRLSRVNEWTLDTVFRRLAQGMTIMDIIRVGRLFAGGISQAGAAATWPYR